VVSLPPLAGFTVAVTADRRCDEQVELLHRRGAEVMIGPAIKTVPFVDDDRLRDTIDDLIGHPPDVTILLTGVGTRGLVEVAEGMGRADDLLDALALSEVMARGPKAAGAATTAGLDVSWLATTERTSEVYERIRPRCDGLRVAVQRDGADRGYLAEQLDAAGADVVDIPVYRWSLPDDTAGARRIVDAACSGGIDAVTVTSSPAVDHLIGLADEAGLRRALVDALTSRVLPVCVGPVCAETAESHGITPAVTPKRARLGAMVQALAAELGARARSVRLNRVDVTVQGARVVVGDEHVRLTDRERAVMHALLDARGAVVAKQVLLRRVWAGEQVDEHAVEVTIARLRRRLGLAGAALQTVPRRGYRLAEA
jgi:uroporphyrinogen-III synthase